MSRSSAFLWPLLRGPQAGPDHGGVTAARERSWDFRAASPPHGPSWLVEGCSASDLLSAEMPGLVLVPGNRCQVLTLHCWHFPAVHPGRHWGILEAPSPPTSVACCDHHSVLECLLRHFPSTCFCVGYGGSVCARVYIKAPLVAFGCVCLSVPQAELSPGPRVLPAALPIWC